MATISHTIKWVSNTEELKQQLLSGTGSIIAMKEAVDKTARSLGGEGLFKAANNTTAAVMQLGGASKLSAAEQARVNTQLDKAIEKYRLMGKEPPAAMLALAKATEQAGTQTGFFSKFAGDLKTQVLSMAAGFVTAQAAIALVKNAFRLLTDFLSGSIQSYQTAELATTKLTAALTAQGTETPRLVRQYQDLASQFQQTTMFGDDLLVEMQALLVELGGVMPHEMDRALQATTDLAAGLGIDLRSATLLVGKAFAGETGSLTRYGIVIDQAKLKAQGATAVLDAIQKKFGGQAAAQAATYAGRVAQLANAWDDFKESVGKALVGSNDAGDGIQELTRAVEQMSRAMRDVKFDVAGAIDALKILTGIKGAEFGRSWNELWQMWRKGAMGVVNDMPILSKLAKDMGTQWRSSADTGLKPLVMSLEDEKDVLKTLNTELTESQKAHKAADDAVQQFIVGAQGAAIAVNLLDARIQALFQSETNLSRGLAVLPGQLKILSGELLGVEDSAARAGVEVGAFGVSIGRQLGVEVDTSTFSLNKWIGTLQQIPVVAAKAGRSIGQTFVGAINKAFGAIDTILSGVHNKFVELAVVIARTVQNVMKNLAEGDIFGAIVAGAVGAFTVLKQLITGISPEIKKARNDLEAFKRELASMATATQMAAAQADVLAGKWDNVQAALFAIQAQDALIAMGKSAAEAAEIVGRAFDTDNYAGSAAAIREIRDAIDAVKQSAIDAAAAQQQAFADLPQDIGEVLSSFSQLGVLAPKVLQDMIQKAREAGIALKEIAEFKIANAEQMGSGLSALIEQFKLLSEKGIKPTKDQLQTMMNTAVAAFQTMVRNGVPLLDIIRQLGPSAMDLQKMLTAAGLEGTAAFKELMKWARFAGDEVKGPLLNAATALNQMLIAMANNGQLTQRRFNDMQGSVKDLFDQMRKSGLSQKDALQALQPNLQTIWELYHDQGMEIDANTKRLLLQAEKQGLIGEKFRSTEDIMTSGIMRIVQLLEVWLTSMGIDLPKAIDKADDKLGVFGSHGTDVFKGLINKGDDLVEAFIALQKPIDLTIGVNDAAFREWLKKYNKIFGGGHGAIVTDQGPLSFASGSGGLQDFGSGTLAMLHGREAVVTEREIRDGGPAAGSASLEGALRQEMAALRAEVRQQNRGLKQQLFFAVRDGMAQRRGRR